MVGFVTKPERSPIYKPLQMVCIVSGTNSVIGHSNAIERCEVRAMKRRLQLQWFWNIAGFVVALRFCKAAQLDETKGFPLTAAMEWRKAAELCLPMSRLAEGCWSEWERIMRLPRRLAGPIGVAGITAFEVVETTAPTPHRISAAVIRRCARSRAEAPVRAAARRRREWRLPLGLRNSFQARA
jgi:hypothetical protein